MPNAATVIAMLAVVCALFFAARYIYKEKKKGARCIGCPHAGSCQKQPENSTKSCYH